MDVSGTHPEGMNDIDMHSGQPQGSAPLNPQPPTHSATQSSTQPQPQAGPSSTAKGKRRLDQQSDSESQNESPTGPRIKRTRPNRSKKPQRPNDWHIRKTDIPEGAERTKAALELHIRTLWCLPDQNSVPPMVTDALRKKFADRFTSATQIPPAVATHLKQYALKINEARQKVEELKRDLPVNSIISNNIRRLPEPDLLLMFGTVAAAGLHRWAPDVLTRDPESRYNRFHEQMALDIFENVSANYAYSHVGNNLAFVLDRALMIRFYRNFVFGYMLDVAKLDKKTPGGVAELNRMSNVYKRRSELASNRVYILKAQGFNNRVIALAQETEAHSDDESDNESDIYTITRKEGRSEKVTNLFRMCDVAYRRMVKTQRGRNHRAIRRREEPADMPRESQIGTTPTKVPIDWFAPSYWNDLLVLERAKIIEINGVNAALPLPEHCRTWDNCRPWKNLSEDAFEQGWGEAALREYNLPTEEEVEQALRHQNVLPEQE